MLKDHTGHPLFNHPTYLAENNDGDVVVNDSDSGNRPTRKVSFRLHWEFVNVKTITAWSLYRRTVTHSVY